MKAGLKIGQRATITTEVTPEMFAQFEGEIIHPAYSTVSMVYHMEWAARQIILPYLEEHEEGMGGEVNVRHLAPSPEGDFITVTAILTNVEKKAIITKVEVKNNNGLIGEGEVTQFILPKKHIQKKLKQQQLTHKL